jgi:hypothetical protein
VTEEFSGETDVPKRRQLRQTASDKISLGERERNLELPAVAMMHCDIEVGSWQ